VVGVACLVIRGNVDASAVGADRFAYLLEYKIPAWPAAECALCQTGVPVTIRYAHGAGFRAGKAEKR
jgi:orotate phosphoribosyltransferase